jgi:hypothetical protein
MAASGAGIPAWERWALSAILFVFAALALGYSAAPIWETPDEIDHYEFVRTLTATHRLPNPALHKHLQDHQAPLHYLLVLPINLIVNPDNLAPDSVRNPFYPWALGVLGNDNKNHYLHPADEAFPYTGDRIALTIHLMRLVSIIMGALTILSVHAAGRILWPAHPARRLLAAGVVAMWPQLVWMSSTFNNDNLIILASSVTLLLLVRQVRDGLTWRRALLLGMALGLALLSKANGLFLAIPVGVTFLLDRRTWKYAPLTLAATLAIAGWWYARNLQLIGQLSGWEISETYGGAIRDGSLALDVGIRRLPFAYWGAIARFGHVTVGVGSWVYRLFTALAGLAGVGLVVRLVRRQMTISAAGIRQIVLTGVFMLTWVGYLLYQASLVWQGNQGRYLLPGIAAWGLIAALGLDGLIPRRAGPQIALSIPALMAPVTAICLAIYFLPTYRPLPLPETIEQPLYYRFGDAAELIGISPAYPHAEPGETITITLHWRALQPTTASLYVFLHSEQTPLIRRDSVPGTGNLLSTDWQPGQTWAERYIIEIPPSAERQRVDALLVGLYDPATGEGLQAYGEDGAAVTPHVGRIAITGPLGEREADYDLGGIVGLMTPTASAANGQITACLEWVSKAPAPIDYHVFVHILSGGSEPLAQADHAPKGGLYPTTAWTSGEVIVDCFTLEQAALPPEGWNMAVGLYDPATWERLPVATQEGEPLPDGMVVISSRDLLAREGGE